MDRYNARMRNNRIGMVRVGRSLESGAEHAQSTCTCLSKRKGTEGSRDVNQGTIPGRLLFKEE